MTFGEPQDIEDAVEDSDRRLGVFPNPPLDECPLVPLGFYGGYVVFAMPEGEIREEPAAKIGALIKVDLFNCQDGQGFLTYWRDSDDKFQRDLAVIWLIRKCREAGYWDRSRPQRGLGVWPADGLVVLHRGPELWTWLEDGTIAIASVAEVMRERSGPIYRLRACAPAPDAPSDRAAGQWARDKLDLWRFEPIGDDGLTGADVMIGWLSASLLGAVAPFRPHLLLYAMLGSGKTTLVRFVHGLLSALSGDVIDSFSAAGLKNDLAGMARPVIIDEAEASPHVNGPGPVELAMDLLRRMATGDGAVRKQGDVGGGSVTQTAVGAVMMAAVNPVKLSAADASRVAEIRLLPVNAAPAPSVASDADLAAVVAEARRIAPALLGRALAGAGRYLADVAAIKAAMVRSGEAPRTADLVAALAAGRRMLLFDEALDAETAAEEVAFWRGMLAQRDGQDAVTNPGADCLHHLLAWPSGQHVHDRIVSIGELVAKWWLHAQRPSPGETGDYEDTLKAHGLKVYVGAASDDARVRPWLLVANHHPALERIFERTNWRDWRRTLPYLDAMGADYATRPAAKQRFGMIQQRATAVPLDPWLERPRSDFRSGQDTDE